jgi:formylglycine-generating enzyme required for sulfatase activity
MTHDTVASDAYDELLDRVLAGTVPDLEAELGKHPGFTADQVRGLRSLARAVTDEAPPPPGQPAALPFDNLGEFKLIRRLGAGNIGMVFLAEQPSLARQVAVKVLRPGLVLSPEASSRLTREAQALARLRHPNVVNAITFGHDRGVHYLAMEHVEGRGLDEILAAARSGAPRPSVLQVTAWCRDVARGLQAAHDAGIVHRDVKPSNIRITPGGEAVLLDFGLARDRPDSTLTTEGAFRGSPRYSSPEQIEPGIAELDGRTDVYSLGVTLYEAVTLLPPFDGSTTEAVFARILAGDAAPPRKVAPGIPRELETVILAAIEPDRGRRYQSAAAFARDLEALLELRDILARPPGLSRRVRKWVRRKPLAAALVAAGVLAVLAAAGVLLARELSDRAVFRRESSEAARLLAAGAFDDAIAAWDRALGVRPADPRALAERASTLARRDRHRAEGLLAEAREKLAQSRDASAKAEAIERVVRQLREEMMSRVLTVEEGRTVGRGEGPAASHRLEQEAAFHAAVNRAAAARALLPESEAPDGLLAEIYLERWRDSLARNDAAARRAWEKLVAEHDRGGIHRAEIEGRGVVSFELSPSDAEVHLFRYEEQADVVEGGERRLVPVPIAGAPTPVPPGTWCLRPLRPGGGLDQDDLVFEMEGRPIQGTLFLVPKKPSRVELLDVLVSVDGRTVTNFPDAIDLIKSGRPNSRRTLTIDGKRGRYQMDVASLEDLGALIGEAQSTARVLDFEAAIWRNGAVRRARVPKGLGLRATSTPLFVSPGCSLGRGPIADRSLAPGSYLAYVSHPAREPQRVPFVLDRLGAFHLAATLRPPQSTPSEWRYVPAGKVRVGRAHALGTGSLPEGVYEVGGFAILDREVTIAEFIGFLNSPEVPEDLKRQPELRVYQRTEGFSMWNQIVRGDDGRFSADKLLYDVAATGVSFVQAEAYAQWLTSLSKTGNRFAIPTDIEWEKAARGADARPYPYGVAFHSLWQKWGRSSPLMSPERVLSNAIDESPYGAFDMMGGVLEWCDRSVGTLPGRGDTRSLRGTAWSLTDQRQLDTEWEFAKELTMAEVGFRIIIRDPPRESRPGAESR